MGANGSILEKLPARVTKPGPAIVPKAEASTVAPRLTASPFQIDHRSELIKEMRVDADILDKEAAHKTALALSLRLSADHLEAHPPE